VSASSGVGARLSLRTRDLSTRGREAAAPIPTPDELKARPEPERRHVLEGLRVELYALTSLVADATVERARLERPHYPPYGLVRSMHTESRMVLASPGPVEEGSLDSFHALGKAYVDTMVFHLHREFDEVNQSDHWLVASLEQLLALFRIDAGPLTRSRMRDGRSFLYGGLHFGVGVCVQLAEVMVRMLAPFPGMTPAEAAQVLDRSLRPANRLATLNIDHVVGAYQDLQSRTRQGWMDEARFVVETSGGRPWRVDLVDEEVVAGRRRGTAATYPTQGCPARISPRGGDSAIATLWRWCGQLARQAGLLGPPEPPPGEGAS